MGKEWKEMFDEAEFEVGEKGLYDAVSKRIDQIMDIILEYPIANVQDKVQVKGGEILMLIAANETNQRKAKERTQKDGKRST